MKELVPIQMVEGKNARVEELEKQGYIIKPEKINEYLKEFGSRKSVNPSKKYWEGKKALITGIGGFVGSHLSEQLISLGVEVHGIVRHSAIPIHKNIEHLRGKITLHEGDITSTKRILNIFEEVKPHTVFHLASESFVPTSFREPVRVVHTNIGGTLNIFEACRKINGNLESIQVACSSEQYGLVNPKEVPLVEDLRKNPFKPRSVYGITKVATEQIAKLYYLSYGIPSIITRAFNHEGPRRGLQFFTSVVHRQIVEILNNKRNNIIIGNPNSYRDFTHVKDMVNGYLLLNEKGKRGEPYNLCSGKGISMGDYVKLTQQVFNTNMPVLIDPKRMRPSEVPLLIGDNTKITKEIGWQPIKPITHIIKEGVKYFQDNPEQLGIESH